MSNKILGKLNDLDWILGSLDSAYVPNLDDILHAGEISQLPRSQLCTLARQYRLAEWPKGSDSLDLSDEHFKKLLSNLEQYQGAAVVQGSKRLPPFRPYDEETAMRLIHIGTALCLSPPKVGRDAQAHFFRLAPQDSPIVGLL